MNKILIFFVITVLLASCEDQIKNLKMTSNEPNIDTVLFQDPTRIQFVDTIIHLGDVQEGMKVPVTYVFKNTGNRSLLIKSVSPSCGCTVADFPKTPIDTGIIDSINAVFNTSNKNGRYQKDIVVNCNSYQKQHRLLFTANVINNTNSQKK